MEVSNTDKEVFNKALKGLIISMGLKGAIVAASIFLIPDKFVYTDKDKGEVSGKVLNARKVLMGALLVQTLALPFNVLGVARNLVMANRAQDGLDKAHFILGALKNIPYIITSFMAIINAALYYKEHGEFPPNMGNLVPTQALTASHVSYMVLNSIQQGGIPALREQ